MNNIQMTAATGSRVSVIPATKRAVQAGGQIKTMQSLRVAAYCRVSTGDESQQTSYLFPEEELDDEAWDEEIMDAEEE